MNHAAIHACGTCPYEPGPGAFAALLHNCRHEITITGGDPTTTARRMQLTAVLQTIKLLNRQPGPAAIHVVSSSQELTDLFNHRGKPGADLDLWQQLQYGLFTFSPRAGCKHAT